MARIIEDGTGFGGTAFAERPVDLVHLARQTMGDKSLEAEVLQLFLRQSELLLGRLETAGDETSWKASAHTLKGSARGIGAWGVARAAETVEGHARDRHSVEAVACLLALSHAIADANAYIRSIGARA